MMKLTFPAWLRIMRWWYWLVIGIVALHLVSILWVGGWSYQAWHQLRLGKLAIAQRDLQLATPLVGLYDRLLRGTNPDLHFVHLSLSLGQTVLASLPDLQTYAAAVSTNDTSALSQSVASWQRLSLQLNNQAGILVELWPRTTIARLFSPPRKKQVTTVLTAVRDASQVGLHFLSGTHRAVILLQNSQEIRATGGFAGSFLFIELTQGQPTIIEVRDIYQPDGQFQGYFPAPHGVEEYLSSGRGWRLPDANWSPDFPTSANLIAQFLAASGYQDIDVIGSINLRLVEKLIQVLGPLYLPDFNVTVTAENIAILARADRAEFFPGSYQKPRFLQALSNQVKFQLASLTKDQLHQLLELLGQGVSTKDIQLFFIDPQLQALAEKYHLAGKVMVRPTDLCPLCQLTDQDPLFFGSIESNVGINKSNAAVTRQVALDIHDQLVKVKMDFQNTATAAATLADQQQRSYTNYQRLWLPVDAQIQLISTNNQRLNHWDEEIITTSSGLQFKQVGWLITVTPGDQADTQVEFSVPSLNPTTPALALFKQSGIPITLYTINWDGQLFQGEISGDTVLTREMLQSSRHDNLSNF